MKTKNMNWNWIYYFYEVARFSSMKEAAKVMNVSLPTISEQIGRLEKELNLKLFERSVRKITLTNEGMSLYFIAKEMFEHGQKIIANVSPDFVGGHPIKVGIQDSVMSGYTSNVISRYWDLYIPYGTVSTEKKCYTEDIVHDLLQEKIDWGIAHDVPFSSKINHKKMITAEVQFCCSRNLYELFHDKKDILRYIPFARHRWDKHLNEKIVNHFSLINCLPSEMIDIDDCQLCFELIEKSRCVSACTDKVILQKQKSSDVVGFTIEKAILQDLYILWPKSKENTLAIKKLLELFLTFHNESAVDPYLQLKIIDIPPEKINSTIYHSQENLSQGGKEISHGA